jgi:hypothetical protein
MRRARHLGVLMFRTIKVSSVDFLRVIFIPVFVDRFF